MGDTWNVNAGITERFKKLDCPESEKKVLQDYLISCLAEGKNFPLKRNRVMIMEEKNKNKYIVLDVVRTSVVNKQFYICPKCSRMELCELLTNSVIDFDLDIDVEDDEELDLVQVLTEKPRYLAVVHVSNKNPKGPGIVTLTSKTLKPKCLVCLGQDRCIHLTIHFQQYKQGLEEDTRENEDGKRIRVERVEPKKPQKKSKVDPDLLDPYQHDGPEANVFKIKIDFIQNKDMVAKNKNSFKENDSFCNKILVAEYDPEEVCDHGNNYSENRNIIFVESSSIIIHHTKDIDTGNTSVLYRPAVFRPGAVHCPCKKFYTGKDDHLLRVSSAHNKMTGRSRVLHFVSYEYYFSYLGKLVMGGARLNSSIKSRKFVDEVFFGHDKTPEYRKVLHKGFEIFCHALALPDDANYCYKCPQKLDVNEQEDDFKDEVEYSIIDGLQMGCRTNGLKADIREDFFQEEVVEEIVVKGIEAKDRTFFNTRQVRNIISTLLSKAEEPTALATCVKSLTSLDLDSNSRSVLALLNGLWSRNKTVPAGYLHLLHELHLETPISALMTPYSSNRQIYEKFMS